jgi:hypothetical protein
VLKEPLQRPRIIAAVMIVTAWAIAFCEMLAEYAREVFPITRPSNPHGGTATKRSGLGRVR